MTTEQNILDLVTIQYQALDARLDVLQASIDSFKGNTSRLAALVRENLQPDQP